MPQPELLARLSAFEPHHDVAVVMKQNPVQLSTRKTTRLSDGCNVSVVKSFVADGRTVKMKLDSFGPSRIRLVIQ